MTHTKPYRILFFIVLPIILVGCSSRFSSLIEESLSENFALSANGAESSHPRIIDGDLKTWGVVEPVEGQSKRLFTITFPEIRRVDRVIIYSRNIVAYQILCWNEETKEWEVEGGIDGIRGKARVRNERHKLNIPTFRHRLNCNTNKIKILVTKAESDGMVTTRTPGKNTIINHRVEYIGVGRNQIRVDLYDIYKRGPAAIREVEVYSRVEKPKVAQ